MSEHQEKIRVLIVDDHQVVRQGLSTFLGLRPEIVVVGEAGDGKVALDMTRRLEPDVVLMDLVMPELDGIAATRQIRALHPQTRVIALTSFTEDDKVIPAIQAGAASYLLKDVTPDALVEAILAVYRGEARLHPDIARKLMERVSQGPSASLEAKVGARQYLKGILARLLLPLIVGILTHVAFQVYLENLQDGKFSGSFLEFYPRYFEGMYAFGGNFAWMGLHLWYLEALFIFSVMLLPLFWWLRNRVNGQRVLKVVGDLVARPGGPLLFALPVILLVLTLDPKTWGMRDLGGWSVFIYPCFLVSGFVIVSHERLQVRIRQARWSSLAIGVVLAAGYLLLRFSPALAFPMKATLADTLLSLACWSWLLAVFGFGFRHLDRNRRFLRYANEAALPFYILHQTVIVSLGYLVVQWAIPDGLKFVFILAVSFVITSGLYESLVRRNNLMRILFGMKPRPRTSPEVRRVLVGQGASDLPRGQAIDVPTNASQI